MRTCHYTYLNSVLYADEIVHVQWDFLCVLSICYVPTALTGKRKDAMKGESNEHRHVISNNVTF